MTQSTSKARPQTVENLSGRMTDVASSVISAGQEMAAQQLDQATILSSEVTQRVADVTTTMFENFAGLGRGGFDIVQTFNQVMMRGVSGYFAEVAAFNLSCIDKSITIGCRLMETRSPEDLIAVQGQYLRESVEDTLAEATKLIDLAAKSTEAILTPLGSQVANTVVPLTRAKAA